MNHIRLPPKKYALVLLGIFSVEFILRGIDPVDRTTWILENVLVVAAVILLVATYRFFSLSRVSYTRSAVTTPTRWSPTTPSWSASSARA